MSNQLPDLPVRKAIFALLSPIGPAVYDMQVPKDLTIPSTYILLTTQTNRQHSTNKCGHLWATSILLDVVSQQNQGFSDRSVLDGICTQINQLIDLDSGDISIAGFQTMNTQVLDTHDISLNTPTMTIDRKLMRYQFILAQTGTPAQGLPYTLPFTL